MPIERRERSPPDEDPLSYANELIRNGRAAQAAEHVARLVETGRGGLLARFLLVRARIAAADTPGALALAREVAHVNPQIAEAALVLGEALAGAQMLPAAIAEFQRALRLDPGLDDARISLSKAWLDAGEPDKAEEALSHLNDTSLAGESYQRALRMRAQSRSDAGYVRHLFDQFAPNYDSRMRAQLAYAAPEILRELADLVLPRKKDLRVLDLGCGTGLAGVAFRAMACRLDGIDLSPAMIDQARIKAIYDHLFVGDMETATNPDVYDLVLAADALVYLGNLDCLLHAVASHLNRDGFFLFTVERQAGTGFDLGPKRRWRHSESYLRDRAAAHGFQIAGLVACSPRKEAGKSVEGLACAFEKAA